MEWLLFLQSAYHKEVACYFYGVFHVILAPSFVKISQNILTSLIFGRLSIVQTPLINKVAGNIATAAFLAPLIVTSPFRRVPPFITNLSNVFPPIFIQ